MVFDLTNRRLYSIRPSAKPDRIRKNHIRRGGTAIISILQEIEIRFLDIEIPFLDIEILYGMLDIEILFLDIEIPFLDIEIPFPRIEIE